MSSFARDTADHTEPELRTVDTRARQQLKNLLGSPQTWTQISPDAWAVKFCGDDTWSLWIREPKGWAVQVTTGLQDSDAARREWKSRGLP